MSADFNLQQLYKILNATINIDKIDWTIVLKYAEKWKTSVTDSLLDLNFVDETTLAKCLAKSYHLTYIPGHELNFNFTQVSFENFDDLMNVCAAPLDDNKLAICDPFDDHRGYLENRFCEREMIVTERSAIIAALREFGLSEWLDEER